MGLVSQAFHEFDLSRLPGHIAVGHTRYSTTGSTHLDNAQPLEVEGMHGRIALAHNGNGINALPLRDEIERDWGCRFSTATDSEDLRFDGDAITTDDTMSYFSKLAEA